MVDTQTGNRIVCNGRIYNDELRAEFSTGATRDRDGGATPPYEGYAPALWQQVADGAQVWYLPAPYWSPWSLRRVVMDASPAL